MMKTTTRAILMASTTLFLGAMAHADAFTDKVIEIFRSKGFERIEVLEGVTQVKVEAIRDTTKLEVIYDRTTGRIIKQEQATADDPVVTPGVEVRKADSDFIAGGGSSDDNGLDDNGSDDGGSDDHGSDDHGSDDHGSDDHGSDDHGSDDGGSDDHGSDDHGSDDHGSDDHGSDDHGSDDHGSDDHGSDDD